MCPKEKSSTPKRMTWNTMLYKQRFRKRIYFVAIITVVSMTEIGVLKPGFLDSSQNVFRRSRQSFRNTSNAVQGDPDDCGDPNSLDRTEV